MGEIAIGDELSMLSSTSQNKRNKRDKELIEQ